MVCLVTCEVRDFQYHIFFNGTYADCYFSWGSDADIVCGAWAISIGQKISGAALGGFTTVIIIQLFTGSIIMISLGIIGYYIAKIYDEVKGRPRYIIASTCGEKKTGENEGTTGGK